MAPAIMRADDGPGHYRERFVRSFLDWVILSILRRKPCYGYEMITFIDEEFGVYISPGSLYPILYNLEESGLVAGTWDNPDRRSKKIYDLTDSGVREYRDGLDSIGRIFESFRRPDSRRDPD